MFTKKQLFKPTLQSSFTSPNGGLFMVLRARWILGGLGETDGETDVEAAKGGEDGASGGEDLLPVGTQTLIFARPGDNVKGAEDASDEEAEVGDLASCPVRQMRKAFIDDKIQQLYILVLE